MASAASAISSLLGGSAKPSRASITIGDYTVNAIAIHLGLATVRDGHPGMAYMGSISCGISVVVNLNDQVNVPFATLKGLFDLANSVSQEKIKDIVIHFWTDDSATDVICTFSFRGWISQFTTSSDESKNHTLSMSIEPELDEENVLKLTLGN